MNVKYLYKIAIVWTLLQCSIIDVFALNGIVYNPTASTSTFTTIGAPATTATSGTPIPASTDEQWAGPFAPTGFNFNYGGVAYNSFYISSNGFISLKNVATGATPANDLSTASSTIIAPLWDDLATSSNGRVAWSYSVGVGVLTVEWMAMLWDKTGTQPCISFQAKLNTASGNVIFAYTRNIVLQPAVTPTGSTNITIPGGTGLLTAGMTVTGTGIPGGTTISSVNSGTQITISNATTSGITSLTFGALPGTTVTNGSASIGLVGYCVGDYYSQTSSSTYSAGSWGKTVLFNNVNLRPSNNQVYTWAPATPTWTPANDTCGSATTITFNPGALTTLTDQTIVMARQVTMASANPGLPGGWAAQTFSNDVWYTFTKPIGITSFELYIDNTCPTSFTTSMAVYTGGCGAFSLVASDNNSNTNSTNNPYLLITGQSCTTAITYWVRVESDQDNWVGNFNITLRPPGTGTNCGGPADNSNDITCYFTANGSYNTSTLGWTMNNFGFGYNIDTPAVAPGTRSLSGQDYVFQFTPPSAGCYDLSLFNTTSSTNPGIFVYLGCPGTSNVIAFSLGAGGTALNINNLTLSTGTYYIVIDNDTSVAASTNFAFSIQNSAVSAPLNDLCSNAAVVTPTVGSSCTGATNYTVSCATPTPINVANFPPPGCAGFVDGATGDVWFTMTSVSANAHSISVQPGTTGTAATDLGMAVYTSPSGCGGPMSLVACDDNSAGLNMPALTVVPGGAGVVYYIRVWSNSGATPGTFRICAISGCTPLNDLCANATPLVLGVNATYQTNVCATGVGPNDTGVPSCWDSGSLNTVWYSVVASSTSMKIRTRLRTLTDSQIAVYSGTCGGVMTQIGCNDNFTLCSSGGGRNSDVTITGLTIGTTYYIRVDGRNAATGTFDIMAVDGAASFPPIPDQDCDLASTVCSNTSSIADPGYTGSGNICDLQGGTCLFSAEAAGVWYSFSTTSTAPGQTLQFTITANNGFSDYDFQLWEVTGVSNPCNLIQTNPTSASFPFRSCNYSAVSTSGLNIVAAGTTSTSQTASVSGGWNSAYNLTNGTTQQFILLVSHFSNYAGGATSGFSLNFPVSTPINIGAPTVQFWKSNAANTTWQPATLTTNWDPGCLTTMSSCTAGPGTIVIQPGPNQPIIAANTSVRNLIISAGATLTINPGITLTICGDLTNNGTLSCGNNSTILFTGSANQNISGTFTGTSALWHCTMGKSSGNLTPNANMDIRGNLTLNTGGTWQPNTRYFRIGGNFTNANGIGSHGASSGTYEFNGGAAQLFTNNTANITLNNVTMNQSVASSLTLAGTNPNMILSNVLTLTQGKIITGAALVDLLSSSPAACTIGNISSYVEGNLRRQIAAATFTYDYPVGDATKGYQRSIIVFSTAPSSTYQLTGYFTSWAGPPVGPAANECISRTYDVIPALDNGYWTFTTPAASGTTGTYHMRLMNLNYTNSGGASGWTIMKYPISTSGPWQLQVGSSCFAASTVNDARRLGMVDFNAQFATAQSQDPLPIELLSFTVEPKAVGNLCRWSTASETNNEYFNLERSFDGDVFKTINRVEGYGVGSTTETRYYSYLDGEVCKGIVYYRLKQVDIDGHFSYSDVIAVNCNKSNTDVAVYPNPANFSITYTFFEETDGNVTMEVLDMVGKIVLQETHDVKRGYNTIESSVNNLSTGVYYLKLIRPDGESEAPRMVRFMKK